jgi:REP element-mobilizing transposase RayT
VDLESPPREEDPQMKDYQSLAHTTWDCKYHIVFNPKCRKQRIFGALHRELGEIFHKLAAQKESKIIEGYLMPGHVHMCTSIPPKYAVAHIVGYIKGKVRYRWRGGLVAGSAILAASTSGVVGILYRRWGWMRRWFGPTSVTRNPRMNVTTR